MTHVVCEPCNDCKYTDCVVVCPVDCFYQDDVHLWIHPQECIDCEACVPECPVDAIFPEARVPERWATYTALNSDKALVLKAVGKSIAEKQEPKEGPGCVGRAKEEKETPELVGAGHG